VELATLLELLYSAVERRRTVCATVHRWRDHAREIEVLRSRGLYRDPPPIPPEEGSWGKPARVIDSTTRVWAASPYWLRWQTEFVHDGVSYRESVGFKEGELFWQQFSNGSVHSNERDERRGSMSTTEERLLDPAPLLGEYRFDITGQTTMLGRAAVAVQARRRPGSRSHDFGPLADRLSLVVDRERGVLLRVAVTVEGHEIAVDEITEIVFDEPIPPETFRRPTVPPEHPTDIPH
jgi:hypothetical protein